jgi:hypothetical protein
LALVVRLPYAGCTLIDWSTHSSAWSVPHSARMHQFAAWFQGCQEKRARPRSLPSGWRR